MSKPSTVTQIKRKRAYHHGSLRKTAIAAALKLVSKRGPSGFTLAEAAKLAGVVPSALYRHFADREALLAAVAQEGFETLLERLKSALKTSEGDARSFLVDFGVEYFRFATSYPAHFQVMFGAEIDKRKYPQLLAAACNTLDLLTSTTEKITSNPKKLVMATWSMFHGLSVLTLDDAFSRTNLSNQPEELLRKALPLLANL
jgi:AcrR family transcriptional regulator